MRAAFSFVLLALTATSAFASPLEARASGYKLLSDGTKGTVEGKAADFGATYHASTFLSQQGCSSTALISKCYTAKLPSSGELETKDHRPWILGGVGSKQRAVLITPAITVSTPTVIHRFKIHLSTSFTKIPKGEVVTLAAFHNADSTVGAFSLFALEAKTWTGEETSGTYIYLNAVDKDTGASFPIQYPGFADGRTIEFTFSFTTTGTTVSSRVVETGESSTSQHFTAVAIAQGAKHAITLGPARNPVKGSQALKVWFGDYVASQQE
ncbi:hypothetical protein BN946_scf184936.g11 [Trametes cinnabarina]|uniref:Uncharacterized protein n=1 Tax=Pycnoporus cinnabarinus TaxID=5643 RepID=A0A060STV8_PYCCI|nr:hypothetical protein BN946_scf184936.g11 [Trametes cinnabarina]